VSPVTFISDASLSEQCYQSEIRKAVIVTRLGAVVIGRNEGERFRRCLKSLRESVSPIVYVDSGSTDGSAAYAREHDVDVVELDSSIPFTAARGRNAGFDRIRELAPNAELVMFVDGDCEVAPEWLPAAETFLREHEDYAVACGRRRERFPNASVYNYLCDVEWNTPVGDADACGGDAMMRVKALAEVSSFNPSLIAGEEPELCIRLQAAGWKIRRLNHEMTLHDANVTRFSQWWTRAVRAGHAYAEVAAMHTESSARRRATKSLKTMLWAFVLPATALGLSGFTSGLSLALLLLYPLNVARIAMRLRRDGEPRPHTVATFLMLSKFPEAQGWLRYQTGHLTGKRAKIIEYKAP
jgi:GT2 family glycosyltransferase